MSMQVVVGGLYKHFKGNIYKVVSIATHTETEERLVIYINIDIPDKVWARPYEMFTRPVDKNKYPQVLQEYRFQFIEK